MTTEVTPVDRPVYKGLRRFNAIMGFLHLVQGIFMIVVSWDYLGTMWKYPQISPGLRINQVYPQSILIFGYALMLLRLAQVYLHWWHAGDKPLPGMLDEDFPEVPIEDEADK